MPHQPSALGWLRTKLLSASHVGTLSKASVAQLHGFIFGCVAFLWRNVQRLAVSSSVYSRSGWNSTSRAGKLLRPRLG